jgi:AcrR family transcriptional regulator
MPRQALSTDELSAFRERIREAAAHLFATAGYPAVTMRAVAAEVGCSPMTPYRYFASKEHIFAAVRAEAFRRFADVQEKSVRGLEDSYARLDALGHAYVDFAVTDPESYRLMFELGQAPLSDHPEVAEEGERAWKVIRGVVGDAIDAGALTGDPDTVTHVFWAGVHGVASLALAGKLEIGVTLDRLVEPMLTTLVRGNVSPSQSKTFARTRQDGNT